MIDETIQVLIDGLKEGKAQGITLLDLQHLADTGIPYLVICEGSSPTHLAGITHHLIRYAALHDLHPAHLHGLEAREWIALDFCIAIVHVFLPEARQYYDMESLWADAKRTVITNE